MLENMRKLEEKVLVLIAIENEGKEREERRVAEVIRKEKEE
jgi:hypothetical protein